MSKVRVSALAKELGIPSKEAVAWLNANGEYVKSASSTVEAPVERKLREAFPAKDESPKADKSPGGAARPTPAGPARRPAPKPAASATPSATAPEQPTSAPAPAAPATQPAAPESGAAAATPSGPTATPSARPTPGRPTPARR